MNLTIEQAKPEEAEALTAVAVAAKGYWGYPQEWLDLWREELVITAEKIRAGDYHVGRIGQEIVFVYAIGPVSGTTFELEACWMAPAYIGQGYGRALFVHLLQELEDTRRHEAGNRLRPPCGGLLSKDGRGAGGRGALQTRRANTAAAGASCRLDATGGRCSDDNYYFFPTSITGHDRLNG